MMRICLAMCLAAGSAAGDVVFEDRSDTLEEHRYDGGWEHFVGGGVAVFDCNGDGLPDFFAAGGANEASLFINKGGFTFERAGILQITGATGAYPIDVDADGHKDLFVLRVGKNVLLKGEGSCRFAQDKDLIAPLADNAWSSAFTAWWEEDTQRPTLAIGNYVDREDENGPFEACDDNAILRPVAAGYISEKLSPGFCALSILAAEDARGRKTLRLSNDRHYYVRAGYEQLWDISARRFLTEADGWPRVSLWGMGIASRDLNGDERDEVMLTSMGDQVMQLAQPDGTYKPAPFDIGTYAQRPHVGGDGRPSTGWHAEFGDVDNDGRADLFIAKGNVDQMPGLATRDPNNLLVQREDGRFEEVSVGAGVATMARSRGAALADFDADGRLDLIVVNRRALLELYRNVTPATGNWLGIELLQDGGNRDAIGARITVTTPDKTQSVQQVIGGGHAGGQLLPRHFGLGDAGEALVSVTWPDGSVSKATMRANATHRIEKR